MFLFISLKTRNCLNIPLYCNLSFHKSRVQFTKKKLHVEIFNLLKLQSQNVSSSCKTTISKSPEVPKDLKTFLTLIGRNSIEHEEKFNGSLELFLKSTRNDLKKLGLNASTRRYFLRWIFRYNNNIGHLKCYPKGIKPIIKRGKNIEELKKENKKKSF